MRDNFISPDQLMKVLQDSSQQTVGGEVIINGMSFKLRPNNALPSESSEISDDLSRADLAD